ncbi:hypothetical protein CDAR_230521 [Caerostris darwini]|uniref:Uncharacterized protein n=1 Tax=Caerostris darwini TaxID=1538125 RepID=A0AAV4RXJ8_9ARAC|nr:hypothetical protein CDAR_230521 [Caerostris darwini]
MTSPSYQTPNRIFLQNGQALMLSQNHSFARVSECLRNWQREKEVLLHFSHFVQHLLNLLEARKKRKHPEGSSTFLNSGEHKRFLHLSREDARMEHTGITSEPSIEELRSKSNFNPNLE